MTTIYVNNAAGVLAAGVGPSDVQLVLFSGQGSLFPAIPAGGTLWLTIVDPTTFVSEIVQCTARSADTLTVVRGRDGTTATSFEAGAIVEARVTAGLLYELNYRNFSDSPGGPATLDANGRLRSSQMPLDVVKTVSGKIDASVIPTSFATDAEVAAAIAAQNIGNKYDKTGGVVSGVVDVAHGTVGTQRQLMGFGWGTQSTRWRWVLEANASLSLFAYTSSGGTPTKAIQVYTDVAGGGGTQLQVAGHAVWTTASFNPDTKLNANGGTLSYGRVNGVLYWASGTSVGITYTSSEFRFTHAARGPNFIGTSDRRMKTVTGKVKPDMDLGRKLQLVTYEWNEKAEKALGYTGGGQGLLAQAVKKHAPQHVVKAKDGLLGIDYAGLALELALANDARTRATEKKVHEMFEMVRKLVGG